MQANKIKKLNKGCIICQNRNFEIVSEIVRDSSDYKVIKCKKCGLLQLSPIPSIEDDKKFYGQNLQAKNIKAPTNLKIIWNNSAVDTKRRARMVSGLLRKNQTILDFASGYGFFLREMRNLGYKVTGIEISGERRKASSKITKAEVLNINLLEDDANLPKFDCITLFHALEHFSDPVLFLKIIKKHLNKNGKLIVEVPNVGDILLGSCEGYRNFYWQRAHLLYFNVETLRRAVQNAGFSIIDISHIQRYSIENFMNWFVLGKPQIDTPLFKTESAYLWLEDYYKEYLSKRGESDTLIITAEPKTK